MQCSGNFQKCGIWPTLGYIPSVSKHKSTGERIFAESGHVDSVISASVLRRKRSKTKKDDVSKAQDLHTMLDAILDSYIKLQNKGFVWDLRYGDNRSALDEVFTLYNNREMIVSRIHCDSKFRKVLDEVKVELGLEVTYAATNAHVPQAKRTTIKQSKREFERRSIGCHIKQSPKCFFDS